MGHKRDTYHETESLRIEKLRSIYANANAKTTPPNFYFFPSCNSELPSLIEGKPCQKGPVFTTDLL